MSTVEKPLGGLVQLVNNGNGSVVLPSPDLTKLILGSRFFVPDTSFIFSGLINFDMGDVRSVVQRYFYLGEDGFDYFSLIDTYGGFVKKKDSDEDDLSSIHEKISENLSISTNTLIILKSLLKSSSFVLPEKVYGESEGHLWRAKKSIRIFSEVYSGVMERGYSSLMLETDRENALSLAGPRSNFFRRQGEMYVADFKGRIRRNLGEVEEVLRYFMDNRNRIIGDSGRFRDDDHDGAIIDSAMEHLDDFTFCTRDSDFLMRAPEVAFFRSSDGMRVPKFRVMLMKNGLRDYDLKSY